MNKKNNNIGSYDLKKDEYLITTDQVIILIKEYLKSNKIKLNNEYIKEYYHCNLAGFVFNTNNDTQKVLDKIIIKNKNNIKPNQIS